MVQSEKSVAIREKIKRMGKESLDEVLHEVGAWINSVTSDCKVRIYLEDLTKGALSCGYASDSYPRSLYDITFPIISSDMLVSSAFTSEYPIETPFIGDRFSEEDKSLFREFNISAATFFPITHQGRPIGVLCCDREFPGEMFSDEVKTGICRMLEGIAASIDLSRKYHQQLTLARRVDEYKKREAAGFMVHSAVRLIDKVSLASVLVPSGDGKLEILASYSDDAEMKTAYDSLGNVGLERGGSLMSRYLDDKAVISDDKLLKPLSFLDLTQQTLQKRALTQEMSLRSLYVVPRYNPETRKIICIVNYYTTEVYRFSEFEMGLLQTHAEMLEHAVEEIGGEHLEIRILAEISELLKEKVERVNIFLTKVLAKATELIGADTGSIAVTREIDGVKYLIVEDEEGNIVGAKHKEWMKKHIPPFKIGGDELLPEERSLTGYVAFSKQSKVIRNVKEEEHNGSFHRLMHPDIKSELAVPIICDDEVIAVICLNSLKTDYFSEEHKRILQIIDRLTSRYLSDLKQIESLQTEVKKLQTDIAYKDPGISSYRLGNIIGNSRKSKEIVDFINTVSSPLFNRITLWNRNVLQEATLGLPSILVLGETGAGKEFFFNNLYSSLNTLYKEKLNPIGELPVKKTNIAAYSGDLTYSELFGHKKGSFTGAYNDRKGILEEAVGGVVFLDEIGDADLKTQVQLLRFLDNGGFVRLGDNQQRYSRVLLVAATNKNLLDEIAKGNFREDLYHRLSELSVTIPSLNQRREDIPDLAVHFLGKLYQTYKERENAGDTLPVLSEEAKKILLHHSYKGNIRELRSILLRSLFFRNGNVITDQDILHAISDGIWNGNTNSLTNMSEQLADGILKEIVEGGDFWSSVYKPFSDKQISRDLVKLVIDRARERGGKSMLEVARYLRAVVDEPSASEDAKREFFRFKNFLYKTVKI
ncbi:MAG: GPMC system transcriptional regulator [Desulfuromonadales bacterium]|nr:GPMC system transcriptional regulator [Desulfuromonadales bacterium]